MYESDPVSGIQLVTDAFNSNCDRRMYNEAWRYRSLSSVCIHNIYYCSTSTLWCLRCKYLVPRLYVSRSNSNCESMSVDWHYCNHFKYILNEVTLYNLIYVRDTILFVLVCLNFFDIESFYCFRLRNLLTISTYMFS